MTLPEHRIAKRHAETRDDETWHMVICTCGDEFASETKSFAYELWLDHRYVKTGSGDPDAEPRGA